MSQAVTRTANNWTPSGNTSRDQLLSEGVRYRADPSGYAPSDGFRLTSTQDGGTRVGTSPDWWDRHGQQLVLGAIAAAGTAGLWGPAVGLGGGGAAAGTGGLVGSGEATISSGAAGLGGTGIGAAGAAGGAGAGGLGMNLGTLSTLGQLGLQGVSAMRNHGSQQLPYGDEMKQLLQLQQQRMTQANPLYQAILQMAMGMMPTNARGMMGGAQPAAMPHPGQIR